MSGLGVFFIARFDCKHSWWPSIPFVTGQERMTTSFVNYALELLRFGTVKDVSDHLKVSWDLVKDIHKKYLEKKYAQIAMDDVESVSIDEFSVAKGHKYMTIIADIRSGKILYAVEGRKKKDIANILKDLKKKQPTSKLSAWT